MKNKSVLITLKGAHLFFSLYAFFSQEQFFSWVPFLGISLLKASLEFFPFGWFFRERGKEKFEKNIQEEIRNCKVQLTAWFPHTCLTSPEAMGFLSQTRPCFLVHWCLG